MYLRFPYLRFPPLRIVLEFSVLAFSILAKCPVSYLHFPYLHFPVLAISAPPDRTVKCCTTFSLYRGGFVVHWLQQLGCDATVVMVTMTVTVTSLWIFLPYYLPTTRLPAYNVFDAHLSSPAESNKQRLFVVASRWPARGREGGRLSINYASNAVDKTRRRPISWR